MAFLVPLKTIIMIPVALLRLLLLIIVFILWPICAEITTKTQYEYLYGCVSRVVLFLFGYYNVIVKNGHLLEVAERENAIAIYNHVTPLDATFLAGKIYPFAFVFNSIHANTFVFRKMVQRLKFIVIRYEKGVGQSQHIVDYVKTNTHERKRLLVVAPEGTLSDGKGLLSFKTGSFVAMHPIQPIVLRFPHKHVNPAWYGNIHIVGLLFRIALQLINYAYIELLPLQYPLPNETPLEFSVRVREKMLDVLKEPLELN
jgi:lysophosphatidylcholine acyltransferase/lyso-PAF acetyltransferase